MIPCFPTSSDTDAHHLDTASNLSSPSHFKKGYYFQYFPSQNPVNYKNYATSWKITRDIIWRNVDDLISHRVICNQCFKHTCLSRHSGVRTERSSNHKNWLRKWRVGTRVIEAQGTNSSVFCPFFSKFDLLGPPSFYQGESQSYNSTCYYTAMLDCTVLQYISVNTCILASGVHTIITQ
jgi:hypothetical protein